MFHVVEAGIGLTFLLEQARVEPTAECVCVKDDEVRGWVSGADIKEAAASGVETLGDMQLRECEVIIVGEWITYQCGQYALVVERVPVMAEGIEGARNLAWEGEGVRGFRREDVAAAGPVGPSRHYDVMRFCRYPACLTPDVLPPRRSPCNNIYKVPEHDFV